MLPVMTTEERKRMEKIEKLETEADLNKVKKDCADKAIVILFWASWDDNSCTLNGMMEEMPKIYSNLKFAYVDCDESDLVDTLDVENVQTVLVIHPEGSGRKNDANVGIKPADLTSLVEAENKFYADWYE
jgi:thioredoxin-like negative regulator of GroEL